MRQSLLKTLSLALTLVGGVNVWAGDFIDDATSITVKQNNEAVTPTVEEVSGKKVLKFTTLSTKDAMIEFTFTGKNVAPGQVFGVIEYTSNVKTGNNNRFRNLTLDGYALEEKSAANTLAFEPNSKKIIICPFLQNENETDGKKMRTFYTTNVDANSFSLTYAKVYTVVNAAETETVITGIGVYTLGEILEKYPALKEANWKINPSMRLYNEDCTAFGSAVTASKTNNGTDNGVIEIKGGSDDVITTLAGAKLFCKAVDFAKIPTNYRYFWLRYLQPTDAATQEDLFADLHEDAILMPNFSAAHSLAYMPTMHKKLIDFDRKMQNATFVDGVAPASAVTIDGKTLGQSTTANWSTYSRELKVGYNSCAMPFKKIANASDVPAGITFYKVSTLSGNKVVFTKITDPTANNAFTDGSAWTPVIIKAEKAGVYTFVGRDAITGWSGITYAPKIVGNSDNRLFFVGSFVNEVPTGDYASTVNYGITPSGASLAKMKADTKTTYYRAFLADSRDASAPALAVSFDNGDGTTDIASLHDIGGVTTDGAVYNLQGVRMTGSQLPRGIYVKNGKKFIVK